MQVLYKILMIAEVICGFCIILLILFQKSSSDGLVGKVSNPFGNASSSIPPITKITRVFVLIFFCTSIGLISIKSKMEKPVSLIQKEEKKTLAVPSK